MTVPVDETPPKTELGEKVRLVTAVASKVKEPLAEDGPMVAVRFSTSFAVTIVVVTVNVALDAPEAIDTVAG